MNLNNLKFPLDIKFHIATFSNDFSVNESDIFAKNNNSEKLGNVLQSISFKGDLAYLVVNKPSKIEIVNRNNFQKTGTITTNLDQPRYKCLLSLDAAKQIARCVSILFLFRKILFSNIFMRDGFFSKIGFKYSYKFGENL